jgi:parallel beta-helix repeat protein
MASNYREIKTRRQKVQNTQLIKEIISIIKNGPVFDFEQNTDPALIASNNVKPGDWWADIVGGLNRIGRRNDANTDWSFLTTGSNDAGFISLTTAKANATRLDTYAALDGVTDDSTNFETAITAALASSTNLYQGYHVLYHPGGTCLLDNPTFVGVNHLMILGNGRSSLFKQKSGAGGFFTISSSTHVRISSCGFDANNVAQFGGVRWFADRDVIIDRNHFYDSAYPRAVGGNDRYSVVMGNGGSLSTDIMFIYNLVEDLQIEIDMCKGVLIAHNVSLRSPTTAAIGCWTVADSGHIEDVLITENFIHDAHNYGIAILKDNASYLDTVIKNVQILNNNIVKNVSTVSAIVVGVLALSTEADDVYEDIVVEGNTIYKPRGTPSYGSGETAIQFYAPEPVLFERCRIRANRIDMAGVSGVAIEMRRASNCLIQGNDIANCLYGINIANGPRNTTVRDNIIECNDLIYNNTWYAGRPILLQDSDAIGGNVVTANRYCGSPTTLLYQSNNSGSNTTDNPVSGNFSMMQPITGVTSWDIGSLNNNASESKAVTVRGVKAGDLIVAALSTIVTTDWEIRAAVTNTDEVTVTIFNRTGGTVDLGSGFITVNVWKRVNTTTF